MNESEHGQEHLSVEFKVRLPRSGDMPIAQYANYMSASHTPHEVILDFAQVALPIDSDELELVGTSPLIYAKPVARIAIPPGLLDSVITVLQARRDLLTTQGTALEGTE